MIVHKTIGELQHEYLQNLLSGQRVMIVTALMRGEVSPNVTSVSRGVFLMDTLNQYRAGMLVNSKG